MRGNYTVLIGNKVMYRTQDLQEAQKQFDACLDESQQAANDQLRGEIMQRCLKIAHDEAHFVHMWVQDENDAFSKKLAGWKPYFTTMNFWQDLYLQ